jgi:sec-independent protein translocase protein TatC
MINPEIEKSAEDLSVTAADSLPDEKIQSDIYAAADGDLLPQPAADSNIHEPAAELPAPLENPQTAEEEGDGKVMSVVDHLDELRTRLVRSLAVFCLAMIFTFSFGREIISFLEIPGKGMTFRALSIEEPVIVYLKVSFYAAIILAAPYILYEVSAFVAPGLKRKERRILAPIVVGGPLLFVAGAAFAYYLALPPMLAFFNAFGNPIAPIQQRLDYYVSLVTAMLFYMGICFQLPIVLFTLSLAGIVNSRQLLSVWRYAVVAASMVAAVITPDPTVISMLIVFAALVALYFGTIMLLKMFGR